MLVSSRLLKKIYHFGIHLRFMYFVQDCQTLVLQLVTLVRPIGNYDVFPHWLCSEIIPE